MNSPTSPLGSRLPPSTDANGDEILARFLDYVAESGLSLYPAQEEALLELMAGKNVILNTPTGSGKSLVATALHFKALAEGRRSFYTSPIKALASEKFFAMCRDFGPENVGMLTGDASINRDAPIICCTAEILSNIALREGDRARVDYAVIDEFHYFADRERGVAWEVPLLTLPQTTFLLMSATLGETRPFEQRLTNLTGRETAVVRSELRPVPLDYEYRETPLHESVEDLVAHVKYPIYMVNFTQRACAEEAQNLMSTNYCTREEKQAIADAIMGVRFDSPYGKDIQKFIKHGVGLHHAGLLPKYRLLVEKLSQKGLLKVICGTDTLGVGVNVPIRTVLFTKLCKYDGEKTGILSVRDFKQISGRAGRRGFDNLGSVVAQAPEHMIENLRLEAKAGGDPAKLRKIVRKKPPEKGYVPWDRDTFERLIKRPPEDLVSRFSVSHGMLLNLLQGGAGYRRGGYGRMIELINLAMTDDKTKRSQRATAKQLFQSLRNARVIEVVPRASGRGHEVRLHGELQPDFSLNYTLSLYLLDTLPKIDPESPDYARDVLTLVESILENPEPVLQKQLDKLKTEKMAELKAEGVEFEERIAELEKLEYPKPNREFIYDTFNAFAREHPWVGQENIRPKSVAREMWETYSTFDEYVKEYGLQRSEGLVLRYVSDVYKALVQSVPDAARNGELDDMVAFFRTMIREVDSSLVDEWEGLTRPAVPSELDAAAVTPRRGRDLAGDRRALEARARAEVLRLLKALAARNWDEASRCVAGGVDGPWDAARFETVMAEYFAEYAAIVLDQEARSSKHTRLTQIDEREWDVSQTIVDPSGDNLWTVDCTIDMDRAREPADPLIVLRRIAPA